jgi:hypothetical protein
MKSVLPSSEWLVVVRAHDFSEPPIALTVAPMHNRVADTEMKRILMVILKVVFGRRRCRQIMLLVLLVLIRFQVF